MWDLCWINIADVEPYKPMSNQRWISWRQNLTSYRRYINVREKTSNISTNSHFYTMLHLCWINIADVERYKLTSNKLWISRRRNSMSYRRYINVGERTSNLSTNSHIYHLLDLCWINIAIVDRCKLTSKQRWIFRRRNWTLDRCYIEVRKIASNSYFHTMLDWIWINIADVDRYKPMLKQRRISPTA